MEKYLTNIKDLVIQALTNGSEIKTKAESGDAMSCFQMGMIHLLGIYTPIDFKKASKCLGNQSLSDDTDANRILGFIAECEGNYSLAFKNYAKATSSTGSNAKKPYINKVFTERNDLQAYLKKFELPSTVLNKEITAILNDYVKGENTKVDSCIKLAMICDDEESCLEAAQALFDEGDYYSAMRWLNNGNIPESNALYVSVKKKLSNSRSGQNLPDYLEIIEIDGNSLITNLDATPSYAGIRSLCDEVAKTSKKEWHEVVTSKVSTIMKMVEDEETARIKKEKDAEEARIRKQKEEEEAARIKKEKDAETARIRKQEEERKKMIERRAKRWETIYSRYKIIYSIISAPVVLILLYFLFTVEQSFISKLIVYSLVFVIFVILPFFVIKWILKKICKL